MSIRVALDHYTHYQYDRMVFLSPQFIRLKPAAHTSALLESYSLTIEPENHVIHWQQDPFGNFIARADFLGTVPMMAIRVQLVAVLEPVNPFDFFIDTYAESFPFTYDAQLKKDLAPYLGITEKGPLLTKWLAQLDQTKRGTVDFLISLNQQLYQAIAYSIRMQPGVQTAEETLQLAIGSCRDSGWLLVQILRHLGLAARFVSGYLAQVATQETIQNNPSTLAEDSLALHAWAEVYVPGAGWIGLDPTSGMLATEGHIPLACTPEPMAAAPVTGTTSLSETTFTYTNTTGSSKLIAVSRLYKPKTQQYSTYLNNNVIISPSEVFTFEQPCVCLFIGSKMSLMMINHSDAAARSSHWPVLLNYSDSPFLGVLLPLSTHSGLLDQVDPGGK